MVSARPARISNELRSLIRYIQAQCMIKGIRIPSAKEITKKIAEKTDKEALLYESFISFK